MQINIYIKKDTIVVLTRHACQCLVVLAAKKLKREGVVVLRSNRSFILLICLTKWGGPLLFDALARSLDVEVIL